MQSVSYIRKFAKTILFLLLAITFGCVESITDTQTSTTPTISINNPITGDTVNVGKNTINYQAADGASGTGLSFYELYVNKVFVKRYNQNTDGSNPIIYLEVDSTLLHTHINYSVKVYNTTGKSKESKLQENIYVKEKIPNMPTNLLLTRLNDFTITLKWDDNSRNETGYELWRKDIGNGTVIDYRIIKSLPINTISTTDGSLSPYIDYYYKVRAINESGPSNFSNEINTSSIPGGPWNLKVEATGTSLVKLTWIDFASNEQGFQIERTDPSTNNFKVLAITGPNTTEYIDNTVAASSSYKYRVAFFTQTTLSGYSNEVSISTFYTDVAAPTNLTAVLVAGPGVKLTWNDNSKNLAKGTVIERQTGTTGQFIEIGSVAADVVEYTDRTVKNGTTYFYKIRQKLDNNVYTPYTSVLRVDIP
ncbi:MAG: fibronectin type III domain-containing protein [Melioribacter sp.]|nr:fibronectin type III domain-containing protein [Melioribacter sp.]